MMTHAAAFLFVLTVGQVDPQAPSGSELADEVIRSRDWLVIGRVGEYGRRPVHTDAIEAQIVDGSWTPPREGDTVTLPDGKAQAWRRAIPDDKGWINDPEFRGGYAYTAIKSNTSRNMLLEASGHSLVYVNGEVRGGDPYATGWVRHPIELQRGLNHLLFLCRRGRLRVELAPPPRAVLFNARDMTLPDLVRGETGPVWAAIPVINTTGAAQRDLAVETKLAGQAPTITRLPAIAPVSMRKVGFRISGLPPEDADEVGVHVRLVRIDAGDQETSELERTRLDLRVRDRGQRHKRTFISEIDGSVQYYAVTPMEMTHDSPEHPALVLTLHGASVEASRQANAYQPKDWADIVAPTNRRPFGFDWEDWGRWDAMEVLALAEAQLSTDSTRTYLTGHSMGGHGTWHIGSLFPARFAAIAPSAGWISFSTYARSKGSSAKTAMDRMLSRAASPSDTLSRLPNLNANGIYILHGDKDDNVPVTEARAMRSHLSDFHTDFAYYERPDAGHWWGNQCVDWPPLFDFLRSHESPKPDDVRQLAFVTSNPAVSASHHWVTIESQIHPLNVSSVDFRFDAETRRLTGTTHNVSRLSIDLASLSVQSSSDVAEQEPKAPLIIDLDGTTHEAHQAESDRSTLCLQKTAGAWRVIPKSKPFLKGPHRYGPFKEAFNHQFLFVYGTKGTDEENSWAFAKARYDAETFWYRGNGSVDVVSDDEFDPSVDLDRSVIIYGNALSNSAWNGVLSDSPVHVNRHRIVIGERGFNGNDLACLFVRPRPGSDIALIGAVTGTGIRGMRLTNTLPYFVSGVAYPDCTILSTRVLSAGNEGVVFAGFFGGDWSVGKGDIVWSSSNERPQK